MLVVLVLLVACRDEVKPPPVPSAGSATEARPPGRVRVPGPELAAITPSVAEP
ncbi:MAG: hypothetical protein H0T79_19420, partial [Deltaproteobacteria bacterium]|nr:hypothetical protein [Deltaproteobacteria bacterium]